MFVEFDKYSGREFVVGFITISDNYLIFAATTKKLPLTRHSIRKPIIREVCFTARTLVNASTPQNLTAFHLTRANHNRYLKLRRSILSNHRDLMKLY